jgi:hypothetical protein
LRAWLRSLGYMQVGPSKWRRVPFGVPAREASLLRAEALPIARARLEELGWRVAGEHARLPPHGAWMPIADALEYGTSRAA